MRTKKTIDAIEFGDDQAEVETVAMNKDFNKLVKTEAFMNEPVDVLFHESSNPNDPTHFILNVNGVNMPVVRGHVITMKRKYLEVAARMKQTRYTQTTPNASQPERIVMVPHTTWVYPFEVRKDENPKGARWLQNVMAEPA